MRRLGRRKFERLLLKRAEGAFTKLPLMSSLQCTEEAEMALNAAGRALVAYGRSTDPVERKSWLLEAQSNFQIGDILIGEVVRRVNEREQARTSAVE